MILMRKVTKGQYVAEYGDQAWKYKDTEIQKYKTAKIQRYRNTKKLNKLSQELWMLSSVTINCQVTKIVMNSGSQLSEL